MSQPSPLYQLVESKLDGTLADWVARHHATDSWRVMAPKLAEQTGITISAETLRMWFAGRVEKKTIVVIADEPAGAA